MSTDLHDDTKAWGESLAALRSLSAEVNAGLLALAENDIQQFETHIAAQQKICDSLRGSRFLDAAKLRALAADLRKAATTLPESPNPLLTPAERMLEIQGRLAQLNRVYATVVVRAQKIFDVLLSLHRGTRQGYSRDGKMIIDDHTWSCEA
jgi:hypothetical protein